MKKRILSIVLLVAMTATLFSGCGGGDYKVELPTAIVEGDEIFVTPVEGINLIAPPMVKITCVAYKTASPIATSL